MEGGVESTPGVGSVSSEFETIELKTDRSVSGEFAKGLTASTGDGETGLEAEPEELVAASTQERRFSSSMTSAT